MRYIKNIGIIMTLCLLVILTGCSSNGQIDPDDYIKSVYPEYKQLTKIEETTEQMRLLKSHANYELVQFKKNGNSYTYNGGHITNVPYGMKTIKTEDSLNIIVFIDNTVVKADRFTIQLNASDKDYITINSLDLLQQDKYIIKSYNIRIDYNEIMPIKFYDKEGKLIPEELIPDL